MGKNRLAEGFIIILLLVVALYQPALAQPSCIGGTDNDGIASSSDVDDDDDGLIEICTLEGLNAIRYELNGTGYRTGSGVALNSMGCKSNSCVGYELTVNLDFSESTAYGNWQPIGNLTNFFNAIFDGNGHTISNLAIDRMSSDRLGLFGEVGDSSHIRKVGLLNVSVKGKQFIGGLVGINRGTVANSYIADADVKALLTVGGLVGDNVGTIGNSYVAGTNVEAIYDSGSNGKDAGGLVGWNRRNIFNSYVTTGTVTGIENVGGLVGNNEDSGNISNSYATGAVIGTENRDSSKIGGLVGLSQGRISNSYATGTVTGNDYIGGFVGSQEQFIDAPLIKNSYAIGKVTATGNNVGGFSGSSLNIEDSYWDKTVNGALDNAVDNNTSKTTVELRETAIGKGIYGNWSDNDWYGGTDYPVLKYTKGSDATNPLCGVSGQPTCGSLLSGQRVFALHSLRISEKGESTNLLENYDPQIDTYTISVTPDVPALNFVLQRFEDDIVVELNGAEVGISTTTELNLTTDEMNPAIKTTVFKITLTSNANDLERTYNITVYQVGLCNTTDLDEDGDGLIEICWPIGLNAIRHQLDGSGYKVGADIPIITKGCNYRNSGKCRGYELGDDLDLTDSNFRERDRSDWLPIGNNTAPFVAIFDGNGHTISDLEVGGADDYVGLFGYAKDSTIANVGLVGVVIQGIRYIGGLVGKNEGRIVNSYVTGGEITETVGRGSSDMGGLVGESLGTIVNSYTNVGVTGERNNIGGLVGRQSGGEIKNSYATGTVTVTGSGSNIGGLVGRQSDSEIKNSYATGTVKVTGTGDNIGGLVGRQSGSSDISDSYWDVGRSGITTSAGGNPKTTVELQRTVIGNGIYSEWNENDWFSASSSDYPILKYAKFDNTNPLCGQNGQPSCGSLLGKQQILALKTLRISTAEGATSFLESFVPEVTTHTVIVTSDVTTLDIALLPFSDAKITVNDQVTTGSTVQIQTVQIQLNSVKSVVSITLAMQGLMHTYNLVVHQVGLCDMENIDEDGDGLIEICSPLGLDAIRHQLNGHSYKTDTLTITNGCNYKNSGRCRGYELMADLDIGAMTDNWVPIGNDRSPFTAILDGNNHTISNLTVTTSTRQVGLFGYARNSTITAIALSGADIEGGDEVGGIVGRNEGAIANSYIIGKVIGNNRVGGLVGLSRGDIFNSYAKADVSGDGDNVGGFVGAQNGGKMLNSYADGMTTMADGDNVGGFIGNQSGGTIVNAYATAAVDGNDYIGGFIGNQSGGTIRNTYATGSVTAIGSRIGGFSGNSVSIVDSYWDTRRSGVITSVGGIPKTTVELQAAVIGGEGGIYENWDLADWYSGTSNDYPILKYTDGNVANANLCGSDGLPSCDTVLGDQFAPLNTLILQSSRGAEFVNEVLKPAFDPKTHEYLAVISPNVTHIRFTLAAPTTRSISYQINDEDPVEIEDSIGTEAATLPFPPISIGSNEIEKIIIHVAPSETESNREATSYTIVVEDQAVFVQLKLLLEGALQRQ